MKTSAFRHLLTAILAAALALPLPALAQSFTTLRDISSIRSAGMGNATRAFASSDEALWVNPAGIAATTRFNINASAAFEPPNGLQLYSIGSIDSQLNSDAAFPMSGGLSYSYYRSGHGEAKRSGSIVLLGLALPLWNQAFTVGVTGKYLYLNGASDTNAATMDVGVILRPISLLSIGAVGYNLIDVHSIEARRSWGFGVALGNDNSFRLAFDLKLEPNELDEWKVSYFAGAEYLFGGVVMPRVGYTYDALRQTHKAGGGVSVFLGVLALEGAYQYIFDGGHFFGFTLRVLGLGGSAT